MASLRIRMYLSGKKVYFVDYVVEGKRIRKILGEVGVISKKEAQQVANEIEKKLFRKEYGLLTNKNQSITLKTFHAEYLSYSKTVHSRQTVESNYYSLTALSAFLSEETLLSAITARDVEKFVKERLKNKAVGTVNHDLRHLKTIFNKAVEWEYVKSSPFQSIKLIRQDNDAPRFLTVEQIDSFLNMLDKYESINGNYDWHRLFKFYLYTGCRRNEALDLKWGDVDLNHKTITFRHTKGKRSRTLSISDKLMELLLTDVNIKTDPEDNVFQSIHPDTVSHTFKKVSLAAGLPAYINLHSLRHTFASHLIMQGEHLLTVSKLLGHSDIKVTMKYAHLAPGHERKAVGNLPY